MRNVSIRVFFLIILFGVFLGFVSTSHSSNPYFNMGENDLVPNRIDPAYTEVSSKWVDSIYNNMSLDEKIGQLFMIPAYSNRDATHLEELKSLVRRYHMGGIIFFQGGPVRQAHMTNALQSVATVPLMVAMDAEWGLGMRLDSTINYPKQMTLGALQNNQLIYQMGKDIAEQMTRLGVHISFSPVVDINNNASNPVIGARSFGEDKMNVASKGLAYMMGLQDNYIMASAKHFPGHGDTDSDSHHTLPVILHDSLRIDSLELYPFKQLIRAGLGSVMVAHLNIPALDPRPNQASTLSKNIITDLLKEKLQFKGLVITDALGMTGVSRFNKPGELEVKALQAGNDVLLMPADVSKSIMQIKAALKSGILNKSDINEKVKKILAAKYWLGLSKPIKIDTENLYSDLNTSGYLYHKRKLIEGSHTLVKNEDGLLPLKELEKLTIASLAIGEAKNNTYQETLSLYDNVVKFQLPKNYTEAQAKEILDTLEHFNMLIISVHNTSMFASRQFGIKDDALALIDFLANRQPVVLNLFSSPYVLNRLKETDQIKSILISYEEGEMNEETAAQIIFGGIPATGNLPVSAGQFKVNVSAETFGHPRLKYSVPEEVGMSEKTLRDIDTIVSHAIAERAMPGCQILIAKEGVVIYNKSFGYHTYLKKNKVKSNDLYDLASLTKILGSVPALMRLYEEKKIKLNDSLKTYLPETDTTNKGSLILQEILTHQARLEPWIPFYLSTLQNLFPEDDFYSRKQQPDYPYMLARNMFITKHLIYKDSIFQDDFSFDYPKKVANNLYMNHAYYDTVYKQIYASELLDSKKYKYSDLGYYMFYKMIEQLTGKGFYPYLYMNFYQPMGANTLGFLPLNRFPKDAIIPTENDLIFRKQLLQGYVHDPGAAMLGGVCGHAGLFSNANDLAKLMQMYLNGGSYGGEKYFEPETIELFTTAPFIDNDNRRALGFDKPRLPSHKYGPACDDISPLSYGHTGFTGTMAWVDPETQVVYIFLSNRIHPDANNTKLIELDIRTKIQEVIYEAMIE